MVLGAGIPMHDYREDSSQNDAVKVVLSSIDDAHSAPRVINKPRGWPHTAWSAVSPPPPA